MRLFSTKSIEQKKKKRQLELGELVRTSDKNHNFFKSDTTRWSYKLHTLAEVIKDTLKFYHLNKLPERYNEELFKRSDLTMRENEKFVKN